MSGGGRSWCEDKRLCAASSGLTVAPRPTLRLLQGQIITDNWKLATQPTGLSPLRWQAATHSAPSPAAMRTPAPLTIRAAHGAGVRQKRCRAYDSSLSKNLFIHMCPVLCFAGTNYAGVLGTGNADDASSDSPVAAATGHTFMTLSAGGDHVCGIRTDGRAICWGACNHHACHYALSCTCFIHRFVPLRTRRHEPGMNKIIWGLESSPPTQPLHSLWMAATSSSPSARDPVTRVPWSHHRRPRRGAGG